jgi:protein transport protein SEC61 subunit alpha
LVHLLWTRNYKNALIEAFYRTHLPNVFEVYGGILVFLFTVYLLNFRIDIPIKSSKARTPSSSFPIRLLYTGNTPILMYAAVLSQILSISASLFRIFPQNLLVRLVGTWAVRPESHQYVAVSGLAYYLQPPFSLVEGLWDPIRSVIYVLTVIVSCVAFAKTWTEFSGSSARDMAKVFKDNGIVIVGHRENSVQRELKRIIPAAAAVGGAVVGATVAATDLLGLSGVGLSMFAGVTLLYTFYEIISQEQQGAAMPGQ